MKDKNLEAHFKYTKKVVHFAFKSVSLKCRYSRGYDNLDFVSDLNAYMYLISEISSFFCVTNPSPWQNKLTNNTSCWQAVGTVMCLRRCSHCLREEWKEDIYIRWKVLPCTKSPTTTLNKELQQAGLCVMTMTFSILNALMYYPVLMVSLVTDSSRTTSGHSFQAFPQFTKHVQSNITLDTFSI